MSLKPSYRLIIFLFCFLSQNCIAQSGTLDKSFGTGGYVIDSSVNKAEFTGSIALQADGKIIVGGTAGNAIIHRFMANGLVDSSFGINGKTIITGVTCSNVDLQENGKIVFTGGIVVGQVIEIVCGQIDSTGVIDSSFGVNGIAQIKVSDYQAQSYSCAIQQDGKILIAGITNPVINQSGRDWFAIRLTKKGVLDSSFAKNGILYGGFTPALDTRCYKILVQPDKKILITGALVTNHTNITVGRYLENGTVDVSFGKNGITTTDLGSNSIATDCALTKTGKIVICGSTGDNSNYITIRYLGNGIVDSSFGVSGIVQTDLQGFYDYARAIVVQPDEKILVSGSSANPQIFQFDFGTVRYDVNGTIDSSFGENGSAITHIAGLDNDAFDMLLQNDGKILIDGTVYTQNSHIAVVRYNNNIILPVTFLNFTVTKKVGAALLKWQTTNQLNNDYFSVERSTTPSAFNWQQIDKIFTKGDIKQIIPYSFEDDNPNTGNNYYRIKEVDKDGNATYSEIVKADFTIPLSIYPNPVIDIIYINALNLNEETELSIFNSVGKLVVYKLVKNNNELDVHYLPTGVYYLKISSNAQHSRIRFLKK